MSFLTFEMTFVTVIQKGVEMGLVFKKQDFLVTHLSTLVLKGFKPTVIFLFNRLVNFSKEGLI